MATGYNFAQYDPFQINRITEAPMTVIQTVIQPEPVKEYYFEMKDVKGETVQVPESMWTPMMKATFEESGKTAVGFGIRSTDYVPPARSYIEVKNAAGEMEKVFEDSWTPMMKRTFEESGGKSVSFGTIQSDYVPPEQLWIVTPGQRMSSTSEQLRRPEPIPQDIMDIISSSKPPLYPQDRPIWGSGTLGFTTENVTFTKSADGTISMEYGLIPKQTHFQKFAEEREKTTTEKYLEAATISLAASTLIPVAQVVSPWSTIEERKTGALGVGLLAAPALLPAKIVGPLFTAAGTYGMISSVEGAAEGDIQSQVNLALSGMAAGLGAFTTYQAYKPPSYKVTKLVSMREGELKLIEGWKGTERPTDIDIFKATEPKPFERVGDFSVKDIQNAIKLGKWNIETVKTAGGVTARKGVWTGYTVSTTTETVKVLPEIPELITMLGKGKQSAFMYKGAEIGGMGTVRVETLYPVKIVTKIPGSGTQIATFAIPSTQEVVTMPFPLSWETIPRPTVMNIGLGLGMKPGSGQIMTGGIELKQFLKPDISFDIRKDTMREFAPMQTTETRPKQEFVPMQIHGVETVQTPVFAIAQEFEQERPTIQTQLQRTRQVYPPINIGMPKITPPTIPAWSLYGPRFGDGRRTQPRVTRGYKYVPTVMGIMSGRTIARAPGFVGPQAAGIRYPVAERKPTKFESFKGGFMDLTRQVRGLSGGVRSFFGAPKPMPRTKLKLAPFGRKRRRR